MKNQSIYSEFSEAISQTQAELLDLLLSSDEDSQYPWHPSDPEAEEFFAQLENEFNLEEWSEAEISEKSEKLFARINECWQPEKSALETLKTSLYNRFANIPQAMLEAIATKAQQVVSSQLSMADQLVQCVNSLLPDWSEDDLQVFARPLAYAMRGSSAQEATSGTVLDATPVDWDQLSDVEKARITLAIANYALNQLKLENSDEDEKL